MERRKALMLTTSLVGGAVVGAELFLSGCTNKDKNSDLLSDADVALLDEVGETILPETGRSPGAKAAKIGLFMKTIVADCYDEKEQGIFIKGIGELEKLAKNQYSNPFMKLNPKQRFEVLAKLDLDTKDLDNEEDPHFFSMMKQLTIWGYFIAEPGVTKALRYNPVPGEFKGCIPYKKGDKAWA